MWQRGRFQTIDAPGAVGTTLFNDTGTITGTYNNPDATPSSPPDSASPTDALPGTLGTAT